ncbi:MAG: aldo/keto reductase [Planctomycetes bacterium]|nr:aldo/keto reductase [Planctomycetota bacterium]
MEYRRLGKSGLQISSLSFGSWVTFHFQADTSAAKEMMSCAYDHGVNFFDNAEVYAGGESERIMGQALQELGWGRDTYCVSSKVFWGGQLPTQRGLSRKHVHDACHAALKRLRVDYLDLFFCHRPDLDTPIEETVRAMTDLIAQGKVLYWGTSEWSADQLSEAAGVARALGVPGPTMDQPQYNMFVRDKVEREFSRLYETIGLGTTIWSPLASGILTGKYANGIPDGSRMSLPEYGFLRERLESDEGRQQVEKAGALQGLATELGTTLPKLAIAWCLKNENVSTVILGASKVSQLQETLGALDVVPQLDAEVLQKIEGILGNKPSELPRY